MAEATKSKIVLENFYCPLKFSIEQAQLILSDMDWNKRVYSHGLKKFASILLQVMGPGKYITIRNLGFLALPKVETIDTFMGLKPNSVPGFSQEDLVQVCGNVTKSLQVQSLENESFIVAADEVGVIKTLVQQRGGKFFGSLNNELINFLEPKDWVTFNIFFLI